MRRPKYEVQFLELHGGYNAGAGEKYVFIDSNDAKRRARLSSRRQSWVMLMRSMNPNFRGWPSPGTVFLSATVKR